ncbi:MAG: acetyl-CoA carboxylase biotin carboxylase subunit [Candidatus Muiribacterium halophilum]|uniref:Biotin carboxylase n=1 Tax=Muiribacterium halophilum TaxID=2053465 RepID=A0A2N5ZAK6_MUIH1|nr:MAG: acetyl-CoA carboxylase biotin carboxylase subunit [Candidatus Muirbacterium halophilum]
MFNKILIANRGEIAIRVIRACKELGIKTVAVYSKADSMSLHRMLADEAVCIGEAASIDSYLYIPNIISAAQITGAEAIHPGYGFLSENQNFVEICEAHDIKFIGPSLNTMMNMSDKAMAKRIAREASVPVLPGSEGAVKDVEDAKTIAKEVGFPVIIKASFGGGGRGMRIARDLKELSHYFEIAQNEALSAFGNPDVYIEKFVENPKHIEVQVLGDGKGKALYLYERDCSVQRKHQKLIEESPCPVLDDAQREDICKRAASLAAMIKYEGAGTLEFLYDKGQFFFMEMNTRLQVEHGVSEMVCNQDLVKWQIKIAAGEELTIDQEDIKINGHAIECRINAEDPENNFMPDAGKAEQLIFPGGPNVRIDSFIYSGYEIPPYYDSMVAKFLVWGNDREEAINRMKRVLSEFKVEGFSTTADFHAKVMDNKTFTNGKYTTKFLEENV